MSALETATHRHMILNHMVQAIEAARQGNPHKVREALARAREARAAIMNEEAA